MIHFDINIPKQDEKKSMRRDWRKYSKESLSGMLAEITWRTGVEGVQQYWNIFENLLINIVDKIAPLVLFVGVWGKVG